MKEWEKDSMVFTNCPGFFTNDDGTTSSTDPNYKWAKSWWTDKCIKRGAHVGGDKGQIFKSPLTLVGENLMVTPHLLL